jgi:hypothetical protein
VSFDKDVPATWAYYNIRITTRDSYYAFRLIVPVWLTKIARIGVPIPVSQPVKGLNNPNVCRKLDMDAEDRLAAMELVD